LAGDVDRDDLRVEALVVRLDRRYSRIVGDVQGFGAESVDHVRAGPDVQPARHLERQVAQLGQLELELLRVLIRGDLQAGTGRNLVGERRGRDAFAVGGCAAARAAAQTGDTGCGAEQ